MLSRRSRHSAPGQIRPLAHARDRAVGCPLLEAERPTPTPRGTTAAHRFQTFDDRSGQQCQANPHTIAFQPPGDGFRQCRRRILPRRLHEARRRAVSLPYGFLAAAVRAGAAGAPPTEAINARAMPANGKPAGSADAPLATSPVRSPLRSSAAPRGTARATMIRQRTAGTRGQKHCQRRPALHEPPRNHPSSGSAGARPGTLRCPGEAQPIGPNASMAAIAWNGWALRTHRQFRKQPAAV